MSTIEEFSDFFLPTKCVLCGKPPSQICSVCSASLYFKARPVERFDLHGCSAIDFDPIVSKLISAFKEGGQRSLAKTFAIAISREVAKPAAGVLLVAVPSRAESFRKRGFSPAQELAIQLARCWRMPKPRQALRHIKHSSDQAGLDVVERQLNLVNVMVGESWLCGRRVLLVDDIVTTGATLVEAARAVTQAAGQVAGFVTLAETKKFSSLSARNQK